MNLIFTGQMTTEQAQAIDTALQAHGIRVADGGGYGQFDWLCERIEGCLWAYAKTKNWKTQSRAEALTDIKRLQSAFDAMGNDAKNILMEIAMNTQARLLFHHTGLGEDILLRLRDIMQTGKGAYGDIPDSIDCDWLAEFGNSMWGAGLEDIAWEMLKEACSLALSKEPPMHTFAGMCGNADIDVLEAHTPSTKGGRPTDWMRQELVKDLADDFHSATGRCATETPNGPFDDFLSACLAVVETPPKERKNNRKLIRKALEHVPKPRRIN